MKKALFLFLVLALYLETSYSKEGPNQLFIIGADFGAENISEKENSFLAAGLFIGYQGIKNIYCGAELFTATDLSISSTVVPSNESISESNLMFGSRLYNRWAYLNLLSGIGYQYGINRGMLLNTVDDGIEVRRYYQKVALKSICFPIELSFGFAHFVGAGFKLKALLGEEPYFGSYFEVSFGKLN